MRVDIRQHQITTETPSSSSSDTATPNKRLHPTLDATDLERYRIHEMLSQPGLAALVCRHHTPPKRCNSSKNSRNPPIATTTVNIISII